VERVVHDRLAARLGAPLLVAAPHRAARAAVARSRRRLGLGRAGRRRRGRQRKVDVPRRPAGQGGAVARVKVVARDVAHERHGQVGVRVDAAGHHELAGRVDRLVAFFFGGSGVGVGGVGVVGALVGRKVDGAGRPDARDLAAGDQHVRALGAVVVDDGAALCWCVCVFNVLAGGLA
jgi:hypothetical protein